MTKEEVQKRLEAVAKRFKLQTKVEGNYITEAKSLAFHFTSVMIDEEWNIKVQILDKKNADRLGRSLTAFIKEFEGK